MSEAMQSGDLVFYVKLELKPECVEEWKAAVGAVIERMSREAAFVSCSLQQDLSDPACFTLYERWREPSVEAFLQLMRDTLGSARPPQVVPGHSEAAW